MLLAFKTCNLRSVLTKIRTLNFYSNVVNFFLNQFWNLLFENFYKVFKIRSKKYLINCRFFLVFRSSLNQIFHSRCHTPKRVTGWRGPSPRHCAQAAQLFSKKRRSGGEPLEHCV